MLRGGGLCVEGPAGSLPRVSPRIRALQDRLLDSLPADGAWECLSPAQREAIISLHRARLTRNIISQGDSTDRDKRQNRKNNKAQSKGGLNRYVRSRSFEDKLESETDDSGVRVASGGTNSSSTSNSQNSHEDDSSDPGVKRAGRFAKSPSADRFARKEAKNALEANKRKGVTNGVGNVNKIISKQLNRSGHPCSSNITLDCRTVLGERRRLDVNRDSSVFEGNLRCYNGEKVTEKHEGISRKNILQRYQVGNPVPSPKDMKESTSSEEYDSGINFRYDKTNSGFIEPVKQRRLSSGIDYDPNFKSDRIPLSDSTPSPCSPTRKEPPFDIHQPRPKNALVNEAWNTNVFPHKANHEHLGKRVLDSEFLSKDSNVSAKLNSNFDYRNKINQEGMNKYSSNWNSIILSKAVPLRNHNIPQAKASPRNSQLQRTSAAPHGRSTGNLVQETGNGSKNNEAKNKTDDCKLSYSAYQDRTNGKKYVRSKSLDRKYLEDSSDDESDFEIRRRTERMRRYAKASQELEAQKNFSDLGRHHYEATQANKPRSKSSWNVCKQNSNKGNLDNEDDSVFRSRSNILNRWKSEESEVTSNMGRFEKREVSRKDFNRYKWRRRSCDFELDMSDNETGKKRSRMYPLDEFTRKQWQRRSCDFEMEFDRDDSFERKTFYDEDWDESLGNEMKILQQRKQLSPGAELQRLYPAVSSPVKGRKFVPLEKPHVKEEVIIDDQTSMDNVILDNSNRYQIRPEISGRKWARIEDQHYSGPTHYPVTKPEKEKGKSHLALRGKLRLFKAILSF